MMDAFLHPHSVLPAAGLLDLNYSYFVVFFSFLALAFVMNRMIFNPLLETLEQREKLTTGSVGEAKHLLEEYDQRLSKYEASLQTARGEAYRELEAQRNAALNERADQLNAVKVETQADIADKKTKLAAEVKTARATLEAEAARTAAMISTTILGRQVGGAK